MFITDIAQVQKTEAVDNLNLLDQIVSKDFNLKNIKAKLKKGVDQIIKSNDFPTDMSRSRVMFKKIIDNVNFCMFALTMIVIFMNDENITQRMRVVEDRIRENEKTIDKVVTNETKMSDKEVDAFADSVAIDILIPLIEFVNEKFTLTTVLQKLFQIRMFAQIDPSGLSETRKQ